MKTRKLVLQVLLSIALLIMALNLSCTLAAGGFHTVGLKDDGTVVAVGDNYFGQCNVGASNVAPVLEGYTLTISSTAGGSVTTPGEGTFTYPYVPGGFGKVVSLVATPATGYRFVNWTGNVGRIADVNAAITTITMIMEGYYSITANFVAVYYDLTVSSSAGGSVTAPGEGTFTYNAGTVANLVAKADSGYRFVNWTGNVGTIANVNSASTTITMNSACSITANFALLKYNLTVDSTAGGSVTTPGEGSFTYGAGTVVNLVAAALGGYRFVNWTGNVGTIANVNAASTTITMNSNYSITANFAVIPHGQYGLTISSGAGGSVTVPGEGTFTYGSGTVVNLVATPATGYGFVNWAGDVGTIANVNAATTTITMQGAYKISARFMAGVVAAKTETVTNSTVDAMAQADTKVVVKGTATVTVARYEDNPGGPPPTGSSSLNPLGKYIDVSFNDTTEVTETEIQLYYTDAQVTVAGIEEESLRLFWWNETAWVQCSNSGVNTDSDYIWAKIRTDTTPSLADLQGTPWGGYGHPTEKGICFIATAAYGTDTAKEIDILREFRDEVLLPNRLGARLISFYYRTSPPIADSISQHEALRTTVKVAFVDPIVKVLNWTHYLWWARGS